MTTKKDGEVEVPPAAPAKPADKADQDIDYDKELAALEAMEGEPVPAPKGKTPEQERKQAEYALTSTAKRLTELGGDPAALLGAAAPVAPAAPVDTSRFVTKDDLSAQEAARIARTPGEAKLIMWYVRNKGLSVSQAHILANEGRVRTAISEIIRSKSAVPSNGGAGPGSPIPETDTTIPELPAASLARVKAAGMVWDADRKAYVGKKSMLKYDTVQKSWVTSLIQKVK